MTFSLLTKTKPNDMPYEPETITEWSDSIKKAIEYSDEPEQLREWLETADIKATFKGVIDSPWKTDNILQSKSLHWSIDLNGFVFDFYGSHNDAETWQDKMGNKHTIKADLLYGVLACCRSDYHCETIFTDWCADFDANSDSMKDKALWERCLTHATKLQRVIPETILDALPS